MDVRLKALGRELARALDAQSPAFDMPAQAARFLEHAGKQPARGRALAAAALAAALFGAALLIVHHTLTEPRNAPLAFEVGGAPGRVGALIAASDQPLPVRFADGSAIVMALGSRARVAETRAHGASVVLQQGRIAVHVIHRDRTDFRVEAGPFEVRVVGTRFDVSWESASQHLILALHEGTVRVSGPALPAARTVQAGERIELFAARAKDVALAPVVPESPAQVPAERAAASQLRSTLGDAPATSIERASSRPTREHAGPAQLARMADAARFSRQPELAVAALLALRARFAHASQARDSAFQLGRVYFDQLRAPAEAARWFELSLHEQPGGVFAREAAGRLMESLQALDHSAPARRAAQHYLARYPLGPHAALARKLLSTPAVPP
jgi:transmembrane sensor